MKIMKIIHIFSLNENKMDTTIKTVKNEIRNIYI